MKPVIELNEDIIIFLTWGVLKKKFIATIDNEWTFHRISPYGDDTDLRIWLHLSDE